MTYEEAMKCLDDIWDNCEEIDYHIPEEERSGYKMLDDVKKLTHYLIETREALEKQVPKKPKTERKTVDLGNGYSVKIAEIYRCPECGKTIMKGYRCYGLDCGQKIDWGDYE